MASYRIAVIEKFNFAKPEQWETWIRRFKRFRIASGLKSKMEEEQISTLIYSLGDKAEDLLQSFKMSDADAGSTTKFSSALKITSTRAETRFTNGLSLTAECSRKERL